MASDQVLPQVSLYLELTLPDKLIMPVLNDHDLSGLLISSDGSWTGAGIALLIGYTWWCKLHVLTLGIYVLATIHGIGTGSDTQTKWALSIYITSSIIVGLLLWRRVFIALNKRKPTLRTEVTPRRNAYVREEVIQEHREKVRSH